MPNLVGRSEEDAKAQLRAKNLLVGTIRPQESDEPKGTVISQDIDANTEVNENTEISFTISSGRKATPTPTEEPVQTTVVTQQATPTQEPEETPTETNNSVETNATAPPVNAARNQG